MSKTILPEVLREAIRELFEKGYTRDAILEFIKAEAQKYVESDKPEKWLKCLKCKMPLAPTEDWIRGRL